MSVARRTLLILVMMSLLVSACTSDDPVGAPAPTQSTRPPLSDPPDPGPPPANDGLPSDVLNRVIASSVLVSGVACGRQMNGSGFAVGPDLIATAAHVIIGIESITVTTLDGRTIDAIPVLFDTVDDLAVLRAADADLVPLSLGDAADGTVGAVLAWEPDPRPDPTPFRIDRPVIVRVSEVAGTNKVERPSWLMAAEIELGDSGAALVDSSGTAVGVVSSTTRRNAGVAYATRAAVLIEKLTGDLNTRVEVAGCS